MIKLGHKTECANGMPIAGRDKALFTRIRGKLVEGGPF